MIRRIVQIFVIDPNKNVPDDRCLIHWAGPFATSKSDAALIVDLGLPALLAAHNVYRTTIRDKKVRAYEEFLAPATVDDVKVSICTLGSAALD